VIGDSAIGISTAVSTISLGWIPEKLQLFRKRAARFKVRIPTAGAATC